AEHRASCSPSCERSSALHGPPRPLGGLQTRRRRGAVGSPWAELRTRTAARFLSGAANTCGGNQMSFSKLRWLIAGSALAATLVVLVGPAFSAPQHGISFTKGCDSPTEIGDPYLCTYSILNNVDDNKDTLTINGLDDTVAAA